MLSTLKAKRPTANSSYSETRQGLFVFTGAPADFHEWEFRTMSKFQGTKDDDKPALAGKIVEGLRDDALLIAMEIGYKELATADGVANLVEKMRLSVFPYRKEEAKELYKIGHKEDGILSRQSGESMYAYCARRSRWYKALQKLDKKIEISDSIRAELLLEHARLPRLERNMTVTQASADKAEEEGEFESVARALQKLSLIHI